MNYLSVCAVVKDERYLPEWVEYHRIVGVEHFYIYDNSTSPDVSLAKQVIEGFVTVIPFPGERQQFNAYNHCLQNFGKDSRWIAFIDADEFLVPNRCDDLRDLLRNYEAYGGLAVSWLIFGSSYHILRPKGLQTENYTLRSANEFIHRSGEHNQLVKSIVQPARTFAVSNNPHFFLYKDDYNCVNENFELVSSAASRNCIETIQLNHYFTRSYQDFKEKIRRGRADVGGHHTLLEFFEIDHYANLVYDNKILRFLPELKGKLNKNTEKCRRLIPTVSRRLVYSILFYQYKVSNFARSTNLAHS